MPASLRRTLGILVWACSLCWLPAARAQADACEGMTRQLMSVSAFQSTADHFVRTLRRQPGAASALLLCVLRGHRDLAETLMLFQRTLAGEDPGAAEVENAFLHYVINTREPRLAPGEDAELERLLGRYREALLLGPRPAPDQFGLCGHPPLTLQSLRCLGQRANHERFGRDDVVPVRLLDFDASGSGYSLAAATWMAELADLAYWSPRLTGPQLNRWGFELIAPITDPRTETSAFLAARGGAVVLSFRGTSGFRNVVTDSNIRRVKAEWAKGLVHGGFLNASETVWSQILAALQSPQARGKDIWLTGHSLGAALAQLTALRLAKAGYRVRGVYTFGTPRVGDESFVADYDSRLGAQSFPHVNARDVVARVPPVSLGFRASASAAIRHFIGTGHELRLRPGEPSELPPAVGSWRAALRHAIDRATEHLPATLRPGELRTSTIDGPPRINIYGATFERGPLDEHGASEYAFKLVCASIEELLWPAERSRAQGGR